MLPLLLAFVAADLFDLSGQIEPAARSAVSIYRVASPFTSSVLTEDDGRFQFRSLEPGAYTVAAAHDATPEQVKAVAAPQQFVAIAGSIGHGGPDLRLLQVALARLGYATPVDGSFGASTAYGSAPASGGGVSSRRMPSSPAAMLAAR